MSGYQLLQLQSAKNKDRYIQKYILIVLVLILTTILLIYITTIVYIQILVQSPVVKKLAKVNLDTMLDSFQQLDLTGLIQVLKTIEINKIQAFIDNIISLSEQVNVASIIEFMSGIDNCINQCGKPDYFKV